MFRRRDVTPKETICMEGELCKYISFVVHGEFVVIKKPPGNHSLSRTQAGYPRLNKWLKLTEGDCIGLASEYCSKSSYVASVISTSFGVLRCVDIQKVRVHDLWNDTF